MFDFQNQQREFGIEKKRRERRGEERRGKRREGKKEVEKENENKQYVIYKS